MNKEKIKAYHLLRGEVEMADECENIAHAASRPIRGETFTSRCLTGRRFLMSENGYIYPAERAL